MLDDTTAPIPLAAQDEHDLLRRVQAGDSSAYETLVRGSIGKMLSVARRFLRNEEDVCDAVQDAFVSVVRGLEEFKGQSTLSTWIHRIVVNVCLTKLRTIQRKPECSLENLLPHFADEDEHQTPTPRRWAERSGDPLQQQETRQRVRDAIDQLPETYRSVLLLRDIDDVDTEETARRLAISVALVKTRLHRARQALRTLLDPYMQGG